MVDAWRVLLLHSPLVGPSSLAPLAEALSARGHEVVLPDLTAVADHPRPAWVVDAALAAAEDGTVDLVVPHSGAGAVAPLVAAGARARGLVFLDAVLPDPDAPEHHADAAQLAALDEHVAADGRLSPWLSWWPDDLVATLLPDPEQRARVAADCPPVPRAFYDRPVRLPGRWPPAGYVALGGAYVDEVARAGSRGWPCRSLGLHHLATVTAPDTVADAVEDVARALLAA